MSEMICPYNGFKKCEWERCAARMWTKDLKAGSYYLMRVCAIAYNGGTVPQTAKDGDNDG